MGQYTRYVIIQAVVAMGQYSAMGQGMLCNGSVYKILNSCYGSVYKVLIVAMGQYTRY